MWGGEEREIGDEEEGESGWRWRWGEDFEMGIWEERDEGRWERLEDEGEGEGVARGEVDLVRWEGGEEGGEIGGELDGGEGEATGGEEAAEEVGQGIKDKG